MAMVAAGELNDLISAGEARQTNSGHRPQSHCYILTFSTEGTRSTISSAISTSAGPGVPKLVPRSKASATASRIFVLCP